MKKKTGIILIIILLLLAITAGTLYFLRQNKKSALEEKGYTQEEITAMQEILTEEQQKTLETMEYEKQIPLLLKEKDAKFDSLNQYLAYAKKNTEVSLSNVIILVNAQLDQFTYDPLLLDLLKQTYYIKAETPRYLAYQKKNPNKELKAVITEVNSNLDYEFYTNSKESDISKGNLVLVNKYYQLKEDFVPTELVTMSTKYGYANKVKKEVYEQFIKMWDDAKKEGLTLFATSPYRSYYTQQSLYNDYVSKNGKTEADRFSARPGYSEHQTGLAIDMVSENSNFDNFEDTMEYSWMLENAHKYGFILRYPEGKEYITGYMFEPWHYRYVGVETATKVKEANITYEEYYAFYLK